MDVSNIEEDFERHNNHFIVFPLYESCRGEGKNKIIIS